MIHYYKNEKENKMKTLSILLPRNTLTMAACGNTTTEKATTQSSTETSQKGQHRDDLSVNG